MSFFVILCFEEENMDFRDFILPPQLFKTEKWQLGSQLQDELPEDGIALLFVSDYRGTGAGAEMADFSNLRKQLYRLSGLDFQLPLFDFGDLVSGKTIKDTHYILQEILSACHYKGTIPVVIGGSADLSFSLFSSLNFHQKNINFTQISNIVSISNDGEEVTEKNFLSRIFSSKNFSIKNYHHLGYQKHLNELDSVKLIREVDFDIVRLADMMNTTVKTEPYFRKSDLITVNCDAVESFGRPFSVHPQVNGLNRREICAYLKEAGLSENLKSVGIFNFNAETADTLNHQLLAQMIWYLIEGINIQKSHPKERSFETFWLIIDDSEYAFKRDSFSGLWYFGSDDDINQCHPCSQDDYNSAKRGLFTDRILKFLNDA